VVAPIRGVWISVAAVVLQYADLSGEIIPVSVSDGIQLGVKCRSSTSIRRIAEETHMDDLARAGAVAGVSDTHPYLLCVASISLIGDAGRLTSALPRLMTWPFNSGAGHGGHRCDKPLRAA
jgi:hypothetical protein